VYFGPKLVKALGLINEESYYSVHLNMNMIKIFPNDTVPSDFKKDWTNHDSNRSHGFWNLDSSGTLQLSPYCNWRFSYLDEEYAKTYRGVIVHPDLPPPRSPMYLYSNVGRSTITGNRVTDLLREVPHDPTKTTYEPTQIQYKPVRSNVLDKVEVQLAENDGRLVDFESDVTNPLQLRESGWKVGISDLSFPSAVRKMSLKDSLLFEIWWIDMVNASRNLYTQVSGVTGEGDLEFTPRTGTELLNTIRDRYMWRLRDRSDVDVSMYKKKSKSDDPTELLYTVMHRAENGECVLDNSRTCTNLNIGGKRVYPQMSIGIELAKKMKWVKMGKLDDGQPGYVLGPNLRKEFPTEVVPTATDLIIGQNDGDEIFYKIDPDTLHLSCFINWVFTDLDRSYQEAFGHDRRSLFVYSNVGQSMVTGNQITDLLKQVRYDPEVVDLQPRHILYLPVRTTFLDIVETQVSENDGQPVDFASGVTTITLHFRKG